MENKLTVELEVTNVDEILAYASRLREIAEELGEIAYKVRVKTTLKGEGATSINCAGCSPDRNSNDTRMHQKHR